MKLKKFNELCNKIITECCNNQFQNKVLKIGCLFAPKAPFEINKDNYISGGLYKGEDWYAGRVKEILSDDEIIYEITGNYSKRMIPKLENLNEYEMAGYQGFRGPSTIVKYKLIPGEIYYICNSDKPAYGTGEWDETIFKSVETLNSDVETEDGEGCACAISGGDAGSVAGITTNSVFGYGNTAGDSVIHAEKDESSPGITTADIKAMYTLSLNPKTKKPKKNYPVFKRVKIVKESSNKNEEHKCCANCIHLDEWNECGWRNEFIPDEEIYDSYCDQWKEALD